MNPMDRNDYILSIITPVYCPNQYLIDLTEKLFLESLAMSPMKNDFEIIIIDDASPKQHELKAMVEKTAREKTLNIMLIRNEINQGLAKSINRGVHQSRAPYILMTNNDIYAPKDAIPRLLNLLRRDSQYGAVGPMLSFAFRHKIQEMDTGIVLNNFATDEYKKIDSAAESLAQTHNGEITPANSLVGCFLLMPRPVFEDAGGINEHYGLGYHIESDLLIRVRKKGFKLAVDQSTLVFHGDVGIRDFYGPSMSTVKVRAKYNLLRNYAYFVFKNGWKELFSLFNDYNPKK